MLENRKFLSIDDGEIISDDLLARSSIGREVRLRMIDVSRTLEKIGFTAIGIAVTLDNSGIHRRGTPGRLSAIEAAQALEKYLKTLIEKELRKYPLFVSYVFEAHRGGMPHIHAMVFCLPSHLAKISAFFSRFLSREAVTVDVLSPAYLFKQNTGKWHLEQTTAQILGYDVSKLLRKTTSEWENGKRRVYKCDRIKDLQEGKIIHSMQNFKMAKKYPNVYVEIDVFMGQLLDQWNATFGSKKNRAKASSALREENRAPYFLDKTVIFPQSVRKNRKPRKKNTEKTKPLDLDLRAANGDRYHAYNCRVFLSAQQLKALKLAAKKQKNKNGLVCLIRTLFSNYQNGLTPALTPTRTNAYLNFVFKQHQDRQRARQKQARADRKLAHEYGADNIQQLYDYHKHRELWGKIEVKTYEKWHTELWARGLMGDISGRACDAIVDELLDTEEYWELGLREKYQKLGELFPKQKRTPIPEKSPQKIKESEPQKVAEPCLFAPSELVPTSAEKLNKNYHLS